MVKLHVERTETGMQVNGTVEGKMNEVLTELTIGVKDVLEHCETPEIAKRTFMTVLMIALN